MGRACWDVSGPTSSQAPGRGAGESMSHKVDVVKNPEVGNVHFVDVEKPRNMAKARALAVPRGSTEPQNRGALKTAP